MKLSTTTTLTLAIVLGALAAARADTNCSTNPPSPGSTVKGNLIVPPNTGCQLTEVTVTGNVQIQTNAALELDFDTPQGSQIDGNVKVGEGATFIAFNSGGTPATIHGNINADNCSTVEMEPIIVGGNVRIQGCTGQPSGYVDAEIAGNFSCNNNSTECIADDGQVSGNAQVNNNPSAQVFDNTINGNLQCQGNTTIGGARNTVNGHQQGQCADF